MAWLLYAFLCRVCFAVCNLLDGHFTTGELKDLYSRIVLFNIYVLAILPIAYFTFEISPLPDHLYPWVIASGTCFFFYIIPYFKALKISDTSTVVSLFTLSRVFVPFLAYFIVGETLSPTEIVGFVVVLLGALWHAYEPRKSKVNLKLVLLMTYCGLLIAGYSAFSKRVFLEISWIDGLFYFYVVNAILAFSLLLVPTFRPEIIKTLKNFPRLAIPYFPIVLFSLLGNIFFFWSISLTKVTYSTMVGQFQAFIVLILSLIASRLGIIRLQESLAFRDIGQKLVGFLIMALGMWIALN